MDNNYNSVGNFNNGYNSVNMQNNDDKGGFLWGLLGCCVPVAGLILFLVWKDTKPKTAKAAGMGALVYLVLAILSTIGYFVLTFLGMMGSMMLFSV